MKADEWWCDTAVFLFHFCLDSLLIVETAKSDCVLAWRWLCQVVGGVVIHSAASLILLWGGFPCQEAPAWPPAHQPHLAPAYRRPTAHALALRVGGESRLAGLGTDTFWQEPLSPHSAEWSADCSAEHKRPEASIASSCGLQACVEMLASILLETVAAFLAVMAMASQFIPCMCVFCYHLEQSLTLNSCLPTALFVQCDPAASCKSCWPWSSIDSVNFLLCDNEICRSQYLTHRLGYTTCATAFFFF